MRIPELLDPVLVESQGLKIRLSTVVLFVYDELMKHVSCLTSTERKP
ncbi:hypothetical protein SEA_BUD_69 [Mycobacterium phage Bud]|nr:hypothetical protein SEA_BUD_69 [Mycobacterium phage Bud]